MSGAGNTPFVSALATVAREAIAAGLIGEQYRPRLEGGDTCFGVLVTLRMADGRVRAAHGFLGGRYRSLLDEVVKAASAVATSDGVEPPLRSLELRDLSVEVSLVHEPEQVRTLDQLDPEHYGLLIHQGDRRGFLMPHAEGIDSAEEQVLLACRAANIDLKQPFQMFRFDVDRVVESPMPPC